MVIHPVVRIMIMLPSEGTITMIYIRSFGHGSRDFSVPHNLVQIYLGPQDTPEEPPSPELRITMTWTLQCMNRAYRGRR